MNPDELNAAMLRVAQFADERSRAVRMRLEGRSEDLIENSLFRKLRSRRPAGGVILREVEGSLSVTNALEPRKFSRRLPPHACRLVPPRQ